MTWAIAVAAVLLAPLAALASIAVVGTVFSAVALHVALGLRSVGEHPGYHVGPQNRPIFPFRPGWTRLEEAFRETRDR